MSTPAAHPFLELVDLSKSYSGVVAAEGVALSVAAGEIHGLVGKNGAGKSTVVKMLSGAVRPDRGAIRIDGDDVKLSNPWHAEAAGIVTVHQDLEIAPRLSVGENLALGNGFPRSPIGTVSWRRLGKLAKDVLARLGIHDIDPRAPIETLSPANQRMVMIARALWRQARVVILDEPTAALSPTEYGHLVDVVQKLSAEGAAIIYVSHRLGEIFDLCGTTHVMRDGRLVESRPTTEFTREGLVDAITGRVAEDSLQVAVHHARPGHKSARQVDRSKRPLLMAAGLSRGRLRDVSLEVYPGEILGIGGLVGAGRTELLRLLAGIDSPHAGTIEVDGHGRIRSLRDALSAGVVLLPEHRDAQGLFGDDPFFANVTLPSLRRYSVHRWWPSRSKELAATSEAAQRLAIKAPSLTAPVRSLSGGNRQKVLFARWMTFGARVFLCDEPTQGVDVQGKVDIARQLQRAAQEGNAVIVVSSDFTEVADWSDRVLVMAEGRLIGELSGPVLDAHEITVRCYEGAGDARPHAPVASS